MNMHVSKPRWSDLNREGRIEAIKAVYEPGLSAGEIAARIGHVTRNAICGTYFRNAEKLADHPLRAFRTSGRPRKNGDRSSIKVDLSRARGYASQPKPKAEPRKEIRDLHMCGKPLMMLSGYQCRWPVNDADVGELHLFCGQPSEATFCAHHQAKAYRPRESAQEGRSRE